ncbi:Threonine synthase [compost metagenome]
MQLYSTNNTNVRVSFKEAVFNSMPEDQGLYMPTVIPDLSNDPTRSGTRDPDFISNIEHYSFPEIAFQVAWALLGDDIPAPELRKLVEEAINFEAPVVKLDTQTFVLELFHGPSLAFKDFGARFMSRVMGYFLKDGEQLLDVLVATSGDTGGAVALGFLGVPNTRVTILFPKGKVSEVQRLQLTTNGANIRAIAVDGTFDDCQALVKQAFADEELNRHFRLTSANSINIARLIPQTFYYFNAYAQLKRQGYNDVAFVVPSGNFGNIGAGLFAAKMGLPVKQFVAATNANDTVPRFLQSGVYEARPSVQTYANAMDVGAPSNWVRIMDLFHGDQEALKEKVSAFRFTDEDTLKGMHALDEQFTYIACPHTAIAYLGARAYQQQHPEDTSTATVFLSTAHACKFPGIASAPVELPEQVKSLYQKEEVYSESGNDFEGFKAYLLANKE